MCKLIKRSFLRVDWTQLSDLLRFSCSAIGTYHTWKHMVSILTTMGFKQSVCNQIFYVDPICRLWVYLFTLSKVLELGESETSPFAVCLELFALTSMLFFPSLSENRTVLPCTSLTLLASCFST